MAYVATWSVSANVLADCCVQALLLLARQAVERTKHSCLVPGVVNGQVDDKLLLLCLVYFDVQSEDGRSLGWKVCRGLVANLAIRVCLGFRTCLQYVLYCFLWTRIRLERDLLGGFH